MGSYLHLCMWPTEGELSLLENSNNWQSYFQSDIYLSVLSFLCGYIFFKQNLTVFNCSVFEIHKKFCFEQVTLKLDISKICRKGDIYWVTREVNAQTNVFLRVLWHDSWHMKENSTKDLLPQLDQTVNVWSSWGKIIQNARLAFVLNSLSCTRRYPRPLLCGYFNLADVCTAARKDWLCFFSSPVTHHLLPPGFCVLPVVCT